MWGDGSAPDLGSHKPLGPELWGWPWAERRVVSTRRVGVLERSLIGMILGPGVDVIFNAEQETANSLARGAAVWPRDRERVEEAEFELLSVPLDLQFRAGCSGCWKRQIGSPEQEIRFSGLPWDLRARYHFAPIPPTLSLAPELVQVGARLSRPIYHLKRTASRPLGRPARAQLQPPRRQQAYLGQRASAIERFRLAHRAKPI